MAEQRGQAAGGKRRGGVSGLVGWDVRPSLVFWVEQGISAGFEAEEGYGLTSDF